MSPRLAAHGQSSGVRRQESGYSHPSPSAFRLTSPQPLASSLCRPGFTLIELLVVITIIGILAGLASVAAYGVFVKARKSAIKVEITNLESALEKYKMDYGSFPPSLMEQQQVVQHLKKAFPRCNALDESLYIPRATGRIPKLVAAAASDPVMTPAQAMVFWLQGFKPDKQRPISGTGDRVSLVDFEKTRLIRPDTGDPYVAVSGSAIPPPVYKTSANDLPIVFFNANNYLWHAVDEYSLLPTTWKIGAAQMKGARPYLQQPWDKNASNSLDYGTNPNNDVAVGGNGDIDPKSFQKICVNPESFQIISGSLDGEYGNTTTLLNDAPVYGYTLDLYYKSYPDGFGYVDEDNDNITNFTKNSDLESDKTE